MQVIADRPEAPSAIRSDLGAIFVSMELSRFKLADHVVVAGPRREMSKHGVPAGDICTLLTRFSVLKQRAFARTGKSFPIIVIQEAGLDGFWIHRVLQNEGIESHVVDPASIATSRRRLRAKTDRRRRPYMALLRHAPMLSQSPLSGGNRPSHGVSCLVGSAAVDVSNVCK